MQCLNCHYDNLPPDTDYCPRCKIHLPSLLRDVLPAGTALRGDTYCVDYAIGRGSFGITYRARHGILQETFAIKEFYPTEFVIRDQSDQSVSVLEQHQYSFQRALHRFRNEGQILARLDHPNIVRVYDLFEERETAYMVMELIEGAPLSRILKNQPNRRLPLPRVETIVEQLVSALTTLHQEEVYHLDLKPENLILTPDNRVHLIDFGAAKQARDAQRRETRLFTESYAPPELMTGGTLGPESDLFELGMLIHQLVTSKLPPPALERLTEGDTWRPEELISPWDSLVLSALKLRREERPPSVQAWWSAPHQRRRLTAEEPLIKQSVKSLRGYFLHPELAQSRCQLRLGRGALRQVTGLSPALVLTISAGGAALFDVNTGNVLWEIDAPIDRGIVSLNQKYLIASYRASVYVWSLDTGKFIQQFQGLGGPIASLSVSAENHLACCGPVQEEVLVWDLVSGQCLESFQRSQGALSVATLSPNGRYLAAGDHYGQIWLWERPAGQEALCLQGHQEAIDCLVFSPQSDVLASGSRDRTIQLWTLPSGQPGERLKGHLDWVETLAFSADGRYLLSGAHLNDKSLRIWDLKASKEIRRLRGHGNRVVAADFAPDYPRVVSGGYDDAIRLWDAETEWEQGQLKRHGNWLSALACSADGALIASSAQTGEIQLWNRPTGKRVSTLTGHRDRVTSLAFSADGRFLLSGGWDKTLRLWDVTYGNIARAFPSHEGWICAVAISPNQQYIASAGWETIVRLWELTERWQFLLGHRPQRLLKGHSDHITSLAFSADNRLLVTGSKDQSLRLWEVDSGQEVMQLTGHKHHVQCVAFSPDGQFIASGSWDGSVRLWHQASGKQLKPAFKHNTYINTLAYSGDGRYLAAGGRDGVIYIWDLLNAQKFKTLQGHTSSIQRLVFYQNLLIAGDRDGVIRGWAI
ncbi:MAG: serine/threonine-protein kinase [Cyanobacteriota bacterium]|nr:serine/threonine-protein kinase [Cyanobacteriota bacterium]